MPLNNLFSATNIAETGITIPDITCVIDSGKHREMRYVVFYISLVGAQVDCQVRRETPDQQAHRDLHRQK